MIDFDLQDKIKGIALGDYKKGIEVLETVFMQRKKCAEMMLNNPLDNGLAFIELCNLEIKKTLFI